MAKWCDELEAAPGKYFNACISAVTLCSVFLMQRFYHRVFKTLSGSGRSARELADRVPANLSSGLPFTTEGVNVTDTHA